MPDDIVTRVTQLLSNYLNKQLNESFVAALVKFYQKNNTFTPFSQYLKALGLTNQDQCKEVFDLIDDNINAIEVRLKTSEKKQVLPSEIKAKKKALTITFEDEEEIDKPKEKVVFKKIKKPLAISYSDDEEEGVVPEKVASKFKFKKIKREDALRIKSEGGLSEIKDIPTESAPKLIDKKEPLPAKSLSLAELAARDRNNRATGSESDSDYNELKELEDKLDSVENDREWYLTDEFGHTTGDLYEEEEETYKPTHPKPVIRKTKHTNGPTTGGGFDEITGEYIDYDHQTTKDDLSRIPLVSHFLVPPFLEDSKEYLQLQLSGSKGIGPTISPIRDSSSELAIAARQGSMVVKERRTKTERAKQAKDRAGIAGTNMGNVLGVEEKENDKIKEVQQDEIITAEESQTIQQQRRSLPAFAVRNELIRTIRENQVTIVIGETGSGKTTQLTQFLNEEGFTSDKKMIGCTQPRRVAAMSVAKRVSEEMGCKLGQEVGYSIRFEDKTDSRKTVIKYMTEGILLREIIMDPLLENYSCVIMDEAHERSLSTDVLLGLFKHLLARRKDLKLIVTSATMNSNRFIQFFGDSPKFVIPGRTFPVDVLYSKTSCTDYVETAVKQVLTIHLQSSTNDGDILVFMTGQEDIEVTCELLREKLEMLDNPPPIDILPIYSTLPADLQKKIFSKTNSAMRKVVVATNIAETSLTVDGVKYVIDTGLVKMKVYNPKLGMDTLQVIPISVANAQQRSGRAGRTGPGIAYRLYTERASEPEQMYLQPIPEIQRTNLTNVMLLLKSLKIADIAKFPFLDAPPKDLLATSLYDLWTIGAMDNFGDLTSLGHAMIQFPMEPSLAKLILLSCQPDFHCSEEIVTVVSMLSVPGIFSRPKERSKEADASREKFIINESDHLTLVNVYNQWELNLRKFKNNYSKINLWCNKNFLQLKSLLRAKDIKNQIILIMRKNNLPVVRSKSDEDVKKCLAASFYHQSAKIVKINVGGTPEFVNMRHSYMKMYLHPTSSLNGSNLSSAYVIYHELVLTTKEYMNYVTCVDPVWLLEYGYKIYDISDHYKKRADFSFNYINKKTVEDEIERDLGVLREKEALQKEKRKMIKGRAIQGDGIKFKKRRGI